MNAPSKLYRKPDPVNPTLQASDEKPSQQHKVVALYVGDLIDIHAIYRAS